MSEDFYKKILFFFVLIIVSAFMHFLWENLHQNLYTGYEGVSGFMPISVWATGGDVVYVLGAVLLVSLFKDGLAWTEKPRRLDYVGFAILGFCIALFVEYKAFAFDRWLYLDTMPIIPFFDMGLTPVLQMTFLLPCAIFISSRVVQKYYDSM